MVKAAPSEVVKVQEKVIKERKTFTEEQQVARDRTVILAYAPSVAAAMKAIKSITCNQEVPMIKAATSITAITEATVVCMQVANKRVVFLVRENLKAPESVGAVDLGLT